MCSIFFPISYSSSFKKQIWVLWLQESIKKRQKIINRKRKQNLKAFLTLLIRITMQYIWLKPFLLIEKKMLIKFKQIHFLSWVLYHQIRSNSAYRSLQFKNHGALHYVSYLGGGGAVKVKKRPVKYFYK